MLYANDFNDKRPGEEPADALILDGDFVFARIDGNGVLELPGSPLGEFGLLLGTSASDDVQVTARAISVRRGRLKPNIAIGLGGVRGCRLRINALAGQIELRQGDQTVATVPYEWQSGHWTHLRLSITHVTENEWRIEGEAWTAAASRTRIDHVTDQPPSSGRASLWAEPHSGEPIRFDDVVYQRIGE